jgi:hypothetical protein
MPLSVFVGYSSKTKVNRAALFLRQWNVIRVGEYGVKTNSESECAAREAQWVGGHPPLEAFRQFMTVSSVSHSFLRGSRSEN